MLRMAVLVSFQKIIYNPVFKNLYSKTTLGDTLSLLCEANKWKPYQVGPLFSVGISTRHYHGRHLVGYSQEQMYKVVSDVENYEKFVPWCKRSIITDRRPGYMKADLVIGFPPVTERYTSVVTFQEPKSVKAESTTGILFNFLTTTWSFHPGVQSVSQSCVIDFTVSFEFKSPLHSQLANLFFNKVVSKMEVAFLVEAGKRYGKASISSQPLRVSEM